MKLQDPENRLVLAIRRKRMIKILNYYINDALKLALQEVLRGRTEETGDEEITARDFLQKICEFNAKIEEISKRL